MAKKCSVRNPCPPRSKSSGGGSPRADWWRDALYGTGAEEEEEVVLPDSDATLYFDAVTANGGSLSAAEQTEWNNVVVALKLTGLWDSTLIAVYPMLGGTAASCAINAKSPGTNTIVFMLSVAGDFTAKGWKPNGASYGKTGIIPSVVCTPNKFTGYYYSNDHVLVTGNVWGAKTDATHTIQCYPLKVDNNFAFDCLNETTGRMTVANATATNVGGVAFTRVSTTKAWIQVDEIARVANSNTVVGFLPSIELYIAALNLNGAAIVPYTARCAGAAIMDGWTANRITVFNSLITRMNLRLNRAQNRHYIKGHRFIIPNSKNINARDNEEAYSGTLFLKDDTLYAYYGGSSENLFDDKDSVMLATKAKTGNHDEPWTKYGGALPTPVLDYATTGSEAWDAWDTVAGQVVDMGDGTYRMYYSARNEVGGSELWQLGIATSSDLINWTKLSASNPILSGYTFVKVIKDGANWHMIASTATNVHYYYTSSDGIAWTLAGSNILPAGDGSGRIGDIIKFNSKFYLFSTETSVTLLTFGGTGGGVQARANIRMKETTDFVTFVNKPAILFSNRLAEEYGVSAVSGLVQVDTDKWIGIYTSYTPTIAKFAHGVDDCRTASKLFVINNADFTTATAVSATTLNRSLYPYFISHIFNVADQGRDLFYALWAGTWLGAGQQEGLQKYTDFTARSIKFDYPGKILNFNNFGVKLRTRITADDTAYQPLCGQWSATESERCFLMYFENGKLKVNIYSENGEQKLYASQHTNLTDLLDELNGIDDPYGTIEVGFTFQNGVLKLCIGHNSNVATTKTTDTAFTAGLRNSAKDFLIGEDYEGTGNNADRLIRSVFFFCDATESNWLEIDL